MAHRNKNGLCGCGTGKKYKNCHGKGKNPSTQYAPMTKAEIDALCATETLLPFHDIARDRAQWPLHKVLAEAALSLIFCEEQAEKAQREAPDDISFMAKIQIISEIMNSIEISMKARNLTASDLMPEVERIRQLPEQELNDLKKYVNGQ